MPDITVDAESFAQLDPKVSRVLEKLRPLIMYSITQFFLEHLYSISYVQSPDLDVGISSLFENLCAPLSP